MRSRAKQHSQRSRPGLISRIEVESRTFRNRPAPRPPAYLPASVARARSRRLLRCQLLAHPAPPVQSPVQPGVTPKNPRLAAATKRSPTKAANRSLDRTPRQVIQLPNARRPQPIGTSESLNGCLPPSTSANTAHNATITAKPTRNFVQNPSRSGPSSRSSGSRLVIVTRSFEVTMRTRCRHLRRDPQNQTRWR